MKIDTRLMDNHTEALPDGSGAAYFQEWTGYATYKGQVVQICWGFTAKDCDNDLNFDDEDKVISTEIITDIDHLAAILADHEDLAKGLPKELLKKIEEAY